MPLLAINYDADRVGRFPVYHKYPDQFEPQPAFIYLDLETGVCDADYCGLLGSTPEDVWHKRRLRFDIEPQTHKDQITALIEKHSQSFQTILDDSSIEYNGNNNVGVFGDTAGKVIEELNAPDGFQDFEGVFTLITADSFADWLDGDIFPQEGQSVEDFAEYLYGLDGEVSYYSDDLNGIDELLSSLRWVWADHLYSGGDLPPIVAKHLIEHETCEDSQWMPELEAFAKA